MTIEHYMREVCNRQALSDDEELELTRQYAETKDSLARDRLIAASLRLVVQVANRYTRSRSVLADLIQEGTLGLFEALDGFEHQRGCRFSTYAVHFVRGKMLRFMTENSDYIRADFEDEAAPLVAQDQSEKMAISAEQQPDLLVEQIQAMRVKTKIQELLAYFEQTLNSRDLEIFRSLWRSEKRSPLKELSQRHGITAPRIHQIEAEILERLKTFIGDRMGGALAA